MRCERIFDIEIPEKSLTMFRLRDDRVKWEKQNQTDITTNCLSLSLDLVDEEK